MADVPGTDADDLDGLLAGLDEEDATEPVPSPTDPASSPDDPPDAAPEDSPGAQGTIPAADAASASPEAPATPTADPEQPVPPVEGEPFSFTVDGTPVSVPGAVVVGDEIRIPKAAWQSLQSGYVADRSQWRKQVAAWNTERQQMASSADRKVEEIGARLKGAEDALEVVNKLFEDPNRLLAAYQHWEQQRPILQAEMRSKQLEAQLAARSNDLSVHEAQAREAAEVPQMQNALGETIEQIAALDDYKGLYTQDELVSLLRELWEDRGRYFTTADRDYPEYGVVKGQTVLQQELVVRDVARLARERKTHRELLAKQEARLAELQRTAQANAGAVAPSGAPKRVAAAAAPAKAGAKKAVSFRDQLEDEDWSEVFDE